MKKEKIMQKIREKPVDFVKIVLVGNALLGFAILGIIGLFTQNLIEIFIDLGIALISVGFIVYLITRIVLSNRKLFDKIYKLSEERKYEEIIKLLEEKVYNNNE